MSALVSRLAVRLRRPLSDELSLRLAKAGITDVLVPILWRRVERQEGQWDWRGLEHDLGPLRAAGLRPSFVLGPLRTDMLPPALGRAGGADAPEFLERFCAFVRAVRAQHPGVALRIDDGTNAAGYAVRLTRTRAGRLWNDARARVEVLFRACSEAQPSPREISIECAEPGWEGELKRVLDRGVAVDRVVLGHRGAAFLPDPALGAQWGDRVVAAREISGVPIDAELGWPTHRPWFTPARQAEWWRVAAAAALKAGAARIIASDLRDQAHDDPSLGYWLPDSDRHRGLWYYDGTAKPAWAEFLAVGRGGRFGGVEA